MYVVLVMTHPRLEEGKNNGLADGQKGSPNTSPYLHEAYHLNHINKMKSELRYQFIVIYLQGVFVYNTVLFHKSEEHDWDLLMWVVETV